uniref:Uncharacterized protein n=1 Tax=Astyanax mexicanus TaxID=7994 RepID=A0A3B1KIL9_ASTMX
VWENQEAGVHPGFVKVTDSSEEKRWDTKQHAHCPDAHAHSLAIHANQDQKQNTAEVVHGNSGVDQLAEQLAKVPLVVPSNSDCPERQASHHDQVGKRQVAQVDVSYRAGLPLQAEDAENQAITHHSGDADER